MRPAALFSLLVTFGYSCLWLRLTAGLLWDHNNVRSSACFSLKPQRSHSFLNSLYGRGRAKAQPDHLCHCYVPPSLPLLSGPFLLIPPAVRFQLSLLSFGPFSTWCGPYWFLPQHLYHSVSLVAGQTVVTERRGCLVTVGINRPQVRNAVNQETGRRLLQELEAFDSDPELNVAVLHGIGKRRNGWEWAFVIGWSLVGTLIRQANQEDSSYLFFYLFFYYHHYFLIVKPSLNKIKWREN